MAQDWFDSATSGPSQPTPRSGGGVVVRNPWKAKEEARKDEDQQFERERLRIAQEANDRAAESNAATIANMNKPPAGYRWGPPDAQGNPTMQIIPGGPADKVAPAAAPGRTEQIKSLLSSISRLRELAEKRLAVGNWSASFKDNALFNQNRKNVEGALEQIEGDMIQQQIMLLNEASGGKGVASLANSETEARRMAASIANLNPDQDLEEFKRGLDEAESYYLRQAARAEGRELDSDLIQSYLPEKDRQQAVARLGLAGAPGSSGGQSGGGSPGPYTNDPSGNRTFLTERDKAFAEEASALFKKPGVTRADFDALATKYHAQPFGPDLDKALQNPAAATAFAPQPTGFEEAGLTGAIMGPWADSGLGSYAIGAGNAMTAGQLGNIAELTGSSEGGTDVAMNMAQDNAIPYFLGELGGGALATFGAGKALGAGSRLVSNPTVASLLANPMTADAAYGAAFGASEADDPLYGAIGGAATAMGGSWLGSKVGRMMGGSRIDDPLNKGERAVINAMDRGTGISVEEALQQGQDLGLPMTLSDVSPEVAALAGSAIRRNPAVAGQARDMLARRSQGQIDRFRGAVARDLGPVTNIPQRSEDLIQQARAAAEPLYRAAYEAPGATTLDIADILARPSLAKAYGPASRIAAEEGRDPLALGFRFDEGGNAIGVEAPSWQTIDYMKRGLDDVIQGLTDPTTRRLTTEGAAVNNTRKELLGRVDQMNPDYAAARAAYAGPMQERSAMEAGKEAIRANPDQLAVDVAKLPEPRMNQWRLGMQSGLVGQAENLSNSTNPFRVLNTPAMEQRLNILYPDAGDDVARLLLQRDLENKMAGTSNFLAGNSATAERAIADQAFADEGLLRPILEGGVETAITGAPVATMLRGGFGQRAADMFRLGSGKRAMERAEQIAPIALNPDPADTVAQILEMQARQAEYRAAVQAAKEAASRRGGHLGTAATTGTYPYWMGD